MKAKVKKTYMDKRTFEIVKKGATIELSPERFAELSELGNVEEIKTKKVSEE